MSQELQIFCYCPTLSSWFACSFEPEFPYYNSSSQWTIPKERDEKYGLENCGAFRYFHLKVTLIWYFSSNRHHYYARSLVAVLTTHVNFGFGLYNSISSIDYWNFSNLFRIQQKWSKRITLSIICSAHALRPWTKAELADKISYL